MNQVNVTKDEKKRMNETQKKMSLFTYNSTVSRYFNCAQTWTSLKRRPTFIFQCKTACGRGERLQYTAKHRILDASVQKKKLHTKKINKRHTYQHCDKVDLSWTTPTISNGAPSHIQLSILSSII